MNLSNFFDLYILFTIFVAALAKHTENLYVTRYLK